MTPPGGHGPFWRASLHPFYFYRTQFFKHSGELFVCEAEFNAVSAMLRLYAEEADNRDCGRGESCHCSSAVSQEGWIQHRGDIGKEGSEVSGQSEKAGEDDWNSRRNRRASHTRASSVALRARSGDCSGSGITGEDVGCEMRSCAPLEWGAD